jgi:lipopolysaccharide export system permease protein
MRKTSAIEQVTLFDVIAMMLFKLPHLAQKAIPFTVLFGGMMAFWRLNRHHELVIPRAAGVSAWEFLLPVLLIAALIGVIKVTIYSPFASAMMMRYEQLNSINKRGSSSLAALSDDGLWLRQRTDDGHYILHAGAIRPDDMALKRVIVFRFGQDDSFDSRVDAVSATLEPGYWRLRGARINSPRIPVATHAEIRIPSNLTRENIQDSFAKPETMSFWTLPGFIGVLEQAGFSGLRHRIYWYGQLADPFLLCAMVLFAAAFTLRPLRRGGTTLLIAAGIGTGFMIYFATDVVYALGMSARIPALLAAWSPAAVGCLLATAFLFHLEDG